MPRSKSKMILSAVVAFVCCLTSVGSSADVLRLTNGKGLTAVIDTTAKQAIIESRPPSEFFDIGPIDVKVSTGPHGSLLVTDQPDDLPDFPFSGNVKYMGFPTGEGGETFEGVPIRNSLQIKHPKTGETRDYLFHNLVQSPVE